MRTIKLTHEEIEVIKSALQYIYDRNLALIKENRGLLSEEIVSKILDDTKKIYNTQDAFDGDRDI